MCPFGVLRGPWGVFGRSQGFPGEEFSDILGGSWGSLGWILVDWGGPWFPPKGDNIYFMGFNYVFVRSEVSSITYSFIFRRDLFVDG